MCESITMRSEHWDSSLTSPGAQV